MCWIRLARSEPIELAGEGCFGVASHIVVCVIDHLIVRCGEEGDDYLPDDDRNADYCLVGDYWNHDYYGEAIGPTVGWDGI